MYFKAHKTLIIAGFLMLPPKVGKNQLKAKRGVSLNPEQAAIRRNTQEDRS